MIRIVLIIFALTAANFAGAQELKTFEEIPLQCTHDFQNDPLPERATCDLYGFVIEFSFRQSQEWAVDNGSWELLQRHLSIEKEEFPPEMIQGVDLFGWWTVKGTEVPRPSYLLRSPPGLCQYSEDGGRCHFGIKGPDGHIFVVRADFVDFGIWWGIRSEAFVTIVIWLLFG